MKIAQVWGRRRLIFDYSIIINQWTDSSRFVQSLTEILWMGQQKIFVIKKLRLESDLYVCVYRIFNLPNFTEREVIMESNQLLRQGHSHLPFSFRRHPFFAKTSFAVVVVVTSYEWWEGSENHKKESSVGGMLGFLIYLFAIPFRTDPLMGIMMFLSHSRLREGFFLWMIGKARNL